MTIQYKKWDDISEVTDPSNDDTLILSKNKRVQLSNVRKVPTYDDAAARDAALPSPSDGMVVYLRDITAISTYDSEEGLWVNSPGFFSGDGGDGSVLFYCDFNENYKDQVSGDNGALAGTLSGDEYVTFDNGWKGLEFTAAECNRAYWTVESTSTSVAVGCKIKLTTAFTGTANRTVWQWSLNTHYDDYHYQLRFTTDDILQLRMVSGAVEQVLDLDTFLVGVDEEISVAMQSFPDPDDQDADKRLLKLYINGYCIRSINVGLGTYLSPVNKVNRLTVGAEISTINEQSELAIREFWVTDGEPLQDYQILRIHRDGFDTNALADNTIYWPPYRLANYDRVELDYPVFDSANNRLWGSNKYTHVQYTDDETGLTGWTDFGEPEDGLIVRSVFAVGDYVFASVAGTLYRSQISTGPTWTSNLDMTGTNSDAEPTQGYLLASSGYTYYTDADDTVHIVVGEYGADSSFYSLTAVEGGRVWHSTDNGDNWSVIRTLPDAPAGELNQTHVHTVHYTESGRLYLTWGDPVDNTEYSDDHGTNWTQMKANDDQVMAQFVNVKESSNRIIAGLDIMNRGALAVAWPPDFSAYQSYLSDTIWHNAWYYIGQAGGDKYGGVVFSIVVLPNDFALLGQWDHNTSGQKQSFYVADRSGTVCIRAETVEPGDWRSSTSPVLGNERVFMSNFSFPLTMSIRGGPVPHDSRTQWIPDLRST